MDILFWIIFLITSIIVFSLLVKTNVKINKIVSNKEFFPKDPQVKYLINKKIIIFVYTHKLISCDIFPLIPNDIKKFLSLMKF